MNQGSSSALAALANLRRRWWIAALVAVAIVAVTFVYARGLADQYDGVAVVSLVPKPTNSAGGDVLKLVAARYTAIANSPATLHAVARSVGGPIDLLDGAVDASIPADSANVRVTVTLDDAVVAAKAANNVAALVVKDATATDKLYAASVVSPATPDTTPSGPARSLIEFAGVLAGIFFGLFAVGLAGSLRPRFAGVEEIEAVTALPVIANVSAKVRRTVDRAVTEPAALAQVGGITAYFDRAHLLPRTSTAGVGSGRAILVTAPDRSTEAPAAAALIAASLALAGEATLLIDAGPADGALIGLNTGLAPEATIAGVAAGKLPLETAVRATSVDGLSLLASSADRERPKLTLSAATLLIEAASLRYDAVVIYAPALDDDVPLALLGSASDVVVVITPDCRVSKAMYGVSMLAGVQVPIGVVAIGFPYSERKTSRA
jgi:Mrp family chromosome partitioning ATPase